MRTSCLPFRTSILLASIAAFVLVLGLSGCGGGGGAASPTGPGGSTPDVPALTLLPTITSQPADQSLAIGQTTTLTVAASGVGPFSYEWTRDGVVIAGATGASYTVPSAKAGDSGAVWRVSVANANGVTVSRPALITVGGSGERTFIGDPAAYYDQARRSVAFATSIALDGGGNVYGTFLNRVLKISARGVATVVPGLSTTGGQPLCSFSSEGVAFDRTGNLYLLCDSAVYKVTPGGEKILLAGSPDGPGNADGKGTAARFLALSAIVVNDSGVLYVADNGNGTLRRIDPDGTVSTVAGSGPGAPSADGTGPSARFRVMRALALDSQGNVLLSDESAIRKITPAGVVTTVAGALSSRGTADGSVADARFFQLEGIVVDRAGNIFVADSMLNTIRKVTPDGQVVTVAGQRGIQGTADGVGAAAMFAQPQRLVMDKLGNIYVSEGGGTIRKMTAGAEVSTFYGNTGLPASSSTVIARGHEGVSWFVTGMSINPANEVLYSSYNAVLKASAPGDVRLFAQSTSTIFTFGPTVLAVPMEIGEQFHALAAGRNLTYAVVGESNFVTSPKRRLIKFDAAGTLTPIVISADGSVIGEPEVTGIAVDADDNAYVAMVRNHLVCVEPNPCVQQKRAAVYRVAPDGAAVQLLSGASAYPGRSDLSFSAAGGVAVDRSKNVYVADRGNNSVLKISPAGVVSILAGTPGVTGHADGSGAAAQFSGPDAIAADLNGNVFVFDRNNYIIRKIALNGVVTTIAGNAGSSGYLYNGTDGLLPVVNALAADTAGTLYVATDFGIIKIVP